MSDGNPGPSDAERRRLGLCGSCQHVERVDSARGSTFYLCTLSYTDPAFKRYPTLPLRVCSGYQASTARF